MSQDFDELVRIMARLRALDGCPWDRKQTHESLKPYLLEETYEVLETIDHQDFAKLKEELGDLWLQVLFHAQIATEAGRFTIQDVAEGLATKLIRRHPHVFSKQAETDRMDAEAVYAKWEEIKREERGRSGREQSALDGVPKVLPALLRAYQLQARASRVGFDWPHNAQGLDHVLQKVQEEFNELRGALPDSPPDPPSGEVQERISGELGDMLFSLVNLARFLKVNPEDALRQTTNRFSERFHYIEAEAAKSGRRMEELSLEEMDRLWEEAKGKESARNPATKAEP